MEDPFRTPPTSRPGTSKSASSSRLSVPRAQYYQEEIVVEDVDAKNREGIPNIPTSPETTSDLISSSVAYAAVRRVSTYGAFGGNYGSPAAASVVSFPHNNSGSQTPFTVSTTPGTSAPGTPWKSSQPLPTIPTTSTIPNVNQTKRSTSRMPSHLLRYAPGTAPKPWLASTNKDPVLITDDYVETTADAIKNRNNPPRFKNADPRARISYLVTYATFALGLIAGAIQAYFTWRNIELDHLPLCLVFEEEFDDMTKVFGADGTGGSFMREVNMDGSGNGQFEMTTASNNNSYVRDGLLYLMPTLTSDSISQNAILGLNAAGTGEQAFIYNITGCTFNKTAPNGGFILSDDGVSQGFDWNSYLASCSAISNSTSGTVINPVQSARITTRKTATIRFGKVEVRAKMPQGDWLWPAIWMLPRDNAYGTWPLSGEIDIVESRGNGLQYTNRGRNYVQGSLHWGPTTALDSVGKSYSWWTDKRHGFDEKFHTYTLEWTENFIRISVDTKLHTLLDLKFNEPFFKRGQYPSTYIDPNTGKLVPLTDPWTNYSSLYNPTPDGSNTRNVAPFDQEFYLILDVAIGGTGGWFPDGQGGKMWLNGDNGFASREEAMRQFLGAEVEWLPTWGEGADRAMVVDYVKMWKHC